MGDERFVLQNFTEAVTQRCSGKNTVLKIPPNSQDNAFDAVLPSVKW